MVFLASQIIRNRRLPSRPAGGGTGWFTVMLAITIEWLTVKAAVVFFEAV